MFRKRTLLRRGDLTFSNPACYLRDLGDCSNKLTKEHLISDAISHQARDYTAYNWKSDKLENTPYPLAKTAKVLCSKHNSAMGAAFDSTGVAIFRALTKAMADGRQPPLLVNGHDFENFLFQRMAAHHYGGINTSNGVQLRDYGLDRLRLCRAFSEHDFQDVAGLFLCSPPAHHKIDGYETTPIIDHMERKIVGIRASFGAVGFVAFLSPQPYESIMKLYDPRPKGLRLLMNDETLIEIKFSWENGSKSGWCDVRTTLLEPS